MVAGPGSKEVGGGGGTGGVKEGIGGPGIHHVDRVQGLLQLPKQHMHHEHAADAPTTGKIAHAMQTIRVIWFASRFGRCFSTCRCTD